MATYPSTLLPAPLVSGYGITPTDQTARTEMEAGNVFARRRTYCQRDVVSLVWHLSDRQLAIFRAWHQSPEGANGGAGWWTATLLDGRYGMRSRDCRFASMWQAKYVPHLYWEVTATVELRDEIMTTLDMENLMLGIMEKDVTLLWAPTTQADVLVSKIGPDATFAATGAQYDEAGTSLGTVAALHSKGVWAGPSYQNLAPADSNTWQSLCANATPTPNPVNNVGRAPDGTNTAWAVPAGATDRCQLNYDIAADTLSHTWSIFAKPVGAGARVYPVAGIHLANLVPTGTYYDFDSGALQGTALPSTITFSKEVFPDGWVRLSFSFVNNGTGVIFYTFLHDNIVGNWLGNVLFWGNQLTKTKTPVPYVRNASTLVTVASAAGSTTNGLAWEMSAQMTAALSGACTVAAMVTMGVSSADLVGGTTHRNIFSCKDGAALEMLSYRGDSAEASSKQVSSHDGTAGWAERTATWSRNEQHLKVVQTNASASQFRVGNQRIGIDSAIQWGSWATYDGSFNPLTHLRAAYGNTVPLWLSKVMVSNLGGLTDAQILERINA